MRFIDRVDIVVAPGNGGDGVVSFRREAHVPRGGPDGGDGGHGGSVIFTATTSRNTLQDFWQGKTYEAENGRPGEGWQKTGRGGDDLVLLVPLGTVVIDLETEEVLANLSEDGASYNFGGGRGGLGNIHFKSSRNQTPNKAIPGTVVPSRQIRLELKLIADVGLLGFPNAGKSTLISRISAAKPKIADYPFTTLVPNLGVVRVGDGQSFVVADIPGLIQGAAEGTGLGHLFLRHVERCRLLLHMVSTEIWDGGVVERYEVLQDELRRYDDRLASLPQIVVLTKTDLVDNETIAALTQELREACGAPVFAISAVAGHGLKELVGTAWRALRALDDAEA